MYGEYLIPANTKRGRLLFGWFRPFDLILFGAGVLVTIAFVILIPMTSALMTAVISKYRTWHAAR